MNLRPTPQRCRLSYRDLERNFWPERGIAAERVCRSVQRFMPLFVPTARPRIIVCVDETHVTVPAGGSEISSGGAAGRRAGAPW